MDEHAPLHLPDPLLLAALETLIPQLRAAKDEQEEAARRAAAGAATAAAALRQAEDGVAHLRRRLAGRVTAGDAGLGVLMGQLVGVSTAVSPPSRLVALNGTPNGSSDGQPGASTNGAHGAASSTNAGTNGTGRDSQHAPAASAESYSPSAPAPSAPTPPEPTPDSRAQVDQGAHPATPPTGEDGTAPDRLPGAGGRPGAGRIPQEPATWEWAVRAFYHLDPTLRARLKAEELFARARAAGYTPSPTSKDPRGVFDRGLRQARSGVPPYLGEDQGLWFATEHGYAALVRRAGERRDRFGGSPFDDLAGPRPAAAPGPATEHPNAHPMDGHVGVAGQAVTSEPSVG